MTYTLNGSALVGLFEPRQTGDPVANATGLRLNGVDLSSVLVPIASGAAVANPTGYRLNGQDLGTLYAAKFTVPRYPATFIWEGSTVANVPVTRLPESTSLVTTSTITLSLATDGIATISGPSGEVISTGGYLVAGSTAADYEVQCVVSSGTVASNTMSTWTPLTATKVLSLSQSYTHSNAEGTFSNTVSYTLSLRRIGYPTNIVSRTGSLVARVTVAAPTSTAYPAPMGWTNDAVSTVNYTRLPESPGAGTSSTATIVINTDGTVTRSTTSGGIVSIGRWLPVGATASNYDVQAVVTSGSATVNELATFTQLSSNKTLSISRSYTNSQTEGNYSGAVSFSITVRRRAYPVETNTSAASLTATLVVAAPTRIAYPTPGWASGATSTTAHTRLPESPGTGASNTTTIQVRTDGTVWSVGSSSGDTNLGRWLPAGADASWFDVQATVTSGAVTTNQLSTFVQLNAQRTITLTQSYLNSSESGVYSASANLAFTIRRRAYTAETSASTGSIQSIVNVAAPVPTAYPAPMGWSNNAVSTVNYTRLPESPGVGTSSTATIVINTDGTVTRTTSDGGSVAIGRWLPVGAVASNYDIQAVVSSGSATVNDIATFTQVNSAKTLSITRSYLNSQVEGNYSGGVSFSITVRRRAYPVETNTSAASLTATLVVAAPVAPAWPVLPSTGSKSHVIAWTRNTDAPAAGTTATVTLRFNVDGTASVYNAVGGVISSGRWFPAGGTASHYYLRVAGSSLITNPLSADTTVGNTVDVIAASVSYTNAQVHGDYTDSGSWNVFVTRAAYPAQATSGAGDAVAQIQVAPMPLTITPVGNYDNWAGTYDITRTHIFS